MLSRENIVIASVVLSLMPILMVVEFTVLTVAFNPLVASSAFDIYYSILKFISTSIRFRNNRERGLFFGGLLGGILNGTLRGLYRIGNRVRRGRQALPWHPDVSTLYKFCTGVDAG
jgi:hypothetical protein